MIPPTRSCASGKVLIAFGQNNLGTLSSAALYDQTSGVFSNTGSSGIARDSHTATLLLNGKVLLAGGTDSTGDPLASAVLYDPTSGTFSGTGSLATARSGSTATLLPNGTVLIAGGAAAVSLLSAELYNPTSGLFSAAGSLAIARYHHTATLLPNGNVLIAGGYAGAFLTSAERYDVGLGYADSRRPIVASAPTTLVQPAAITLSGKIFRGDSEASGGSLNSSPTNYPLLQLQRVDNDQMLFISPGTPWSETSFTSTTLSTVVDGYYRATIVTNGIPSDQRLVVITGVAAPVTPSLFSATATSTSIVALSWGAVDGEAYEVYRSSLNGPYNLALTAYGTSANDTGLAANTTYLYKVRATGSGGYSPFTALDPATTIVFNDASLSAVGIEAVHVTQLRTAVNAMRAAAGLAPALFANDPPTAGTLILRQHVIDLRTALDAARSTLGLLATGYTDPTITAQSTLVRAVHITELRAGTQ